LIAATDAALPLSALVKAAAPFGLPSFTPLAFAAAGASLVRRGNGLALGLGDSCYDMHGQFVGFRHVGSEEPRVAVLQGR